jgi:predicted anti-sigma-YlaC factor YlaD
MCKEQVKRLEDVRVDCKHVHENFDDYLDGSLSSLVHAAFARHLSKCESCAEMIEDFKTISYYAKELSAVAVPEAVSSRLRARLRSEALGDRRYSLTLVK